MVRYKFEGSGVIVKSPIQTESGLVKDGVTVNPGNVVIDAGPGADAGKYALGASGSTYVRGVAYEKRVGSDTGEKRPVTVIRKGLVRCIADGAIPIGAVLKAGASGKVKQATVDDIKNRANVVIGSYFSKDDGSLGDAQDGDTIIVDLDVTRQGVLLP